MILDALHTTINPIINAFPLIADFDEPTPFCVYQAEPSPIRTKDGIIGYTQRVSISIVDNNIDNIEAATVAVRNAITAMTGTIEATTINMVMLTGETGSIYDQNTDTYQNSMDFIFDTDNR